MWSRCVSGGSSPGSPWGEMSVRLLKRKCGQKENVSRKPMLTSDAPTTTMRALMVTCEESDGRVSLYSIDRALRSFIYYYYILISCYLTTFALFFNHLRVFSIVLIVIINTWFKWNSKFSISYCVPLHIHISLWSPQYPGNFHLEQVVFFLVWIILKWFLSMMLKHQQVIKWTGGSEIQVNSLASIFLWNQSTDWSSSLLCRILCFLIILFLAWSYSIVSINKEKRK